MQPAHHNRIPHPMFVSAAGYYLGQEVPKVRRGVLQGWCDHGLRVMYDALSYPARPMRFANHSCIGLPRCVCVTGRCVLRRPGEKFAADFAAAFAKLMELGVPFPDENAPGPYVAPPGERPKGETSHATH